MHRLERAFGKFCMEYLKFIVQICIFQPQFHDSKCAFCIILHACNRRIDPQDTNQIPIRSDQSQRLKKASGVIISDRMRWRRATPHVEASGDDSASKLLLLRLLGYLWRDVLVSMVVFAACHDLTIP